MKKQITIITTAAALLVSSLQIASGQSWNKTGNVGTNPATDFVGTTDNVALHLRTNGQNRMTIGSGGKVGIGTTTPTAKLDVKATSGNMGGNFYLNTNYSGNLNGINSVASNSGTGGAIGGNFTANASGTATAAAISAYAQNGTTNYGVMSGVLTNGGQTGYGVYGSSSGGGNDWGGYFSSDNIGVEGKATSTPNYGIGGKFNGNYVGVRGTGIDYGGWFQGTFTGVNVEVTTQVGIFGQNNYNYGIHSYLDNVSNDNAMGVSSYVSGHLGANVVGVYGAATYDQGSTGVVYALYGEGNVGATGSFMQASDIKLKKDIHPLTNMLDKIMLLNPSSYNFKTDEYKMGLPAGKQFGVIAQELQKVFPELVARQLKPAYTDSKTGKELSPSVEYLGVNYIGLIPVMLSGIQELKKENVELKSENEKLRNDIAEIKAALGLNTSTGAEKISSEKNVSAINKIVPNPFGNETEIQLSIPSSSQKAVIQITDGAGKLVKEIQVTAKGNATVKLDTTELTSGIYFCSLVIDGNKIATEKMNCTK